MLPFRMAPGLTAIALAAAALTASGAAAGATARPARGTVAIAHKGILPPDNPAKNLPPDPSFPGSASCAGGGDTATCNHLVLRAVAHARMVLEKFGGMSFSVPAYERLTPDEQLFVTANLERTERGLPAAVVLTRSLDKVAQAGANGDTDPPLGQVPDPLPGGGHWVSLGGNWAGGWDNPGCAAPPRPMWS